MKSSFKLVLLDLDGTLYIGNQEVPGACQTIKYLRNKNMQLRFLTNTTTKTQAQLLSQIRSIGIDLFDDELISAPQAARFELMEMQKKISRPLKIWPLVADAVKSDFDDFEWDEYHPDFILIGDIGDRWNITLINSLFNAMHSGAQLIALHKNRFWQTEQGLKTDIGFFVAGLEYICNKTAIILGKPNRDFFQRVLDSVKMTAEQTLMIGDDIDTDIGGAQAMGIHGCLVKTGKYRQAYADQSPVKPDYILDSIADVPQIFSENI